LCDIAPDGQSNLIAGTVRNLELDDDLHGPHTDLVPLRGRPVCIELPTVAYQVAKGRKL
jgi:hypothetical protein